MAEGRVQCFNHQKGCEFITSDGGKEVLIHHSAIEREGFKSLEESNRVSFAEESGKDGPQAVRVRRL